MSRYQTSAEKLAKRPTLSRRFDRSSTTVRCQDGFARLRRDCAQLEDGTWEYAGNASAKGGAAR